MAIVVIGFLIGAPGDNLHNGLLALSFAVVGDVVLRHRPGQREAMLFLAAGAAQAMVFLGRQVGAQSDPAIGTRAARLIAWLGIWPLPLVLVLVGLTIMSFPDGRLPGRLWRVTFAVMVVLGSALSLMSALWPVDYDRAEIVVAHPLDMPGADAAQTVFEHASPGRVHRIPVGLGGVRGHSVPAGVARRGPSVALARRLGRGERDRARRRVDRDRLATGRAADGVADPDRLRRGDRRGVVRGVGPRCAVGRSARRRRRGRGPPADRA